MQPPMRQALENKGQSEPQELAHICDSRGAEGTRCANLSYLVFFFRSYQMHFRVPSPLVSLFQELCIEV